MPLALVLSALAAIKYVADVDGIITNNPFGVLHSWQTAGSQEDFAMVAFWVYCGKFWHLSL